MECRSLGRKGIVLLACVVLSASSALHGAPREPVPPIPDNWKNMYEHGRLTEEETQRANPCMRPDLTVDLNKLHPRWKTAQISICVGRVKSRAVTDAWKQGLDMYGDQLPPDANAKKRTEMELWLRRLVGSYRIEGDYRVTDGTSQVGGTAKCVGVGDGPGVLCSISAKWKAPKEKYKNNHFDNALYDAMQPLVLLFGLEPNTPQVRVTLVDFRAVGMQGFLVDGAVIFNAKSPPEIDPNFPAVPVNPLVIYSWLVSRVAAKPGGDVDVQFLIRGIQFPSINGVVIPRLHMLEFDLRLRR